MKPKHIILGLAAIAIVGLPVFVILSSQSSAGGTSSASAIQAKTRGLATVARLFVRDVLGSDRELPQTTRQTLELVPFGTPLEAARRTMTEHQFTCSLDSYTNPAQMSNSAIWNGPVVKNGQRLMVTNVARLTCKSNGCIVTFWLVNGETTSLAVKGRF